MSDEEKEKVTPAIDFGPENPEWPRVVVLAEVLEIHEYAVALKFQTHGGGSYVHSFSRPKWLTSWIELSAKAAEFFADSKGKERLGIAVIGSPDPTIPAGDMTHVNFYEWGKLVATIVVKSSTISPA